MSSNYRNQLEAYLKTLHIAADKVLDVGGAQLPVKPRVGSWQVGTYKIMDLAQPHTGAPQPDIICDLNADRLAPALHGWLGEFTTVFALEVMEYIYNPMAALRTINRMMHSHAKLIISFPFVYPVHQPIEDDALRYTDAGARKLLKAAGFAVQKSEPRTMGPGKAAWADFLSTEGMHPAKKYEDHHVLGYIYTAIKIGAAPAG